MDKGSADYKRKEKGRIRRRVKRFFAKLFFGLIIEELMIEMRKNSPIRNVIKRECLEHNCIR